MRRNSITSMLSEFVGIHKSPDFRLSSQSMQEINNAIQDEKKSLKGFEINAPKPRQRYMSEGDITIARREPLSLPPQVTMRPKKNKNGEKKERPTSLIERIRRKISYTKTGAIIESEDEEIETRSERILIHITPVESNNVQVVQVSP